MKLYEIHYITISEQRHSKWYYKRATAKNEFEKLANNKNIATIGIYTYKQERGQYLFSLKESLKLQKECIQIDNEIID